MRGGTSAREAAKRKSKSKSKGKGKRGARASGRACECVNSRGRDGELEGQGREEA
jgi:hypothetical protein